MPRRNSLGYSTIRRCNGLHRETRTGMRSYILPLYKYPVREIYVLDYIGNLRLIRYGLKSTFVV
jgi:hypothetical protein